MKRQNAIYARQSVDKKESLSIEEQIENCQEKAPNAIVYEDKGYSGKNIERPALQKLIEDIADNENLIDKVEEYPIYCPKCGKEVLPLEEYQALKKI